MEPEKLGWPHPSVLLALITRVLAASGRYLDQLGLVSLGLVVVTSVGDAHRKQSWYRITWK